MTTDPGDTNAQSQEGAKLVPSANEREQIQTSAMPDAAVSRHSFSVVSI